MSGNICIEKALLYTCCAAVPTPMTDSSPLNQLDPKQFETPAMLKKLASVSRKLADLKGVAASIQSQSMRRAFAKIRDSNASPAKVGLCPTRSLNELPLSPASAAAVPVSAGRACACPMCSSCSRTAPPRRRCCPTTRHWCAMTCWRRSPMTPFT